MVPKHGTELWEFSWDFGLAVTAQKISGLFGCFYFTKIALNRVFVWEMPGMGCGSVPKHGTEIVGIFGDFMGCP